MPFLADRCYARVSSFMFTPGRFSSTSPTAPGGPVFYSSPVCSGAAPGLPVCAYFEDVWASTQRLVPRAIRFPYKQRVEFPRINAFQKAEPRTLQPCSSCGAPDRWKCWSRTHSQMLLGEGRVIDGVMLLRDNEVLDPEDNIGAQRPWSQE